MFSRFVLILLKSYRHMLYQNFFQDSSVGMDLNGVTPAVTRGLGFTVSLKGCEKQCFLWAYSSPDPHGDSF